MGDTVLFDEVLEAAAKLSLGDQEALTEVLHRRIIERRRDELATEIGEAQQEFREGRCRAAAPGDIMAQILRG
jgi:hypothetical protein